jgi:hypothetical protein
MYTIIVLTTSFFWQCRQAKVSSTYTCTCTFTNFTMSFFWLRIFFFFLAKFELKTSQLAQPRSSRGLLALAMGRNRTWNLFVWIFGCQFKSFYANYLLTAFSDSHWVFTLFCETQHVPSSSSLTLRLCLVHARDSLGTATGCGPCGCGPHAWNNW